MHDLLSAGFIPLTLDRQSNVERDMEELPRGFHSVHTSIDYKCASPIYRHTGSSRRTCLRTGRWSGRRVSCSPGESSSSLDPSCEVKIGFKWKNQQICIFYFEVRLHSIVKFMTLFYLCYCYTYNLNLSIIL